MAVRHGRQGLAGGRDHLGREQVVAGHSGREDLVRAAGFKIIRREPDFAPGFFSWNFLAATRD